MAITSKLLVCGGLPPQNVFQEEIPSLLNGCAGWAEANIMILSPNMV
jgi:hypothetical protein